MKFKPLKKFPQYCVVLDDNNQIVLDKDGKPVIRFNPATFVVRAPFRRLGSSWRGSALATAMKRRVTE